MSAIPDEINRLPEKVVGIDLSGSPKQPTGFCCLGRGLAWVVEVREDHEIIALVRCCSPRIVAIDAPLSLPTSGAYRKVDLKLKKMGCPVLPPLFRGMKLLTERAMKLASTLREMGFEVIEVHPRSTLRLLGFKEPSPLNTIASTLGFSVVTTKLPSSRHELDAFAAAYTAWLHLSGKTLIVAEKDGSIVVPASGDRGALV